MDRFVRLVGVACAWLFVASALLAGYEVGMRYVFAAPSSWSQELVTTLCAVSFAFGGARAALAGSHIRITIVPDRLGPRGRLVMEWLSAAVGVFYLSGLLWGVWLQAAESTWRFDAGRWLPELTPGPPDWPLPALVKGTLVAATALFLAVATRELLRLSWRPKA